MLFVTQIFTVKIFTLIHNYLELNRLGMILDYLSLELKKAILALSVLEEAEDILPEALYETYRIEFLRMDKLFIPLEFRTPFDKAIKALCRVNNNFSEERELYNIIHHVYAIEGGISLWENSLMQKDLEKPFAAFDEIRKIHKKYGNAIFDLCPEMRSVINEDFDVYGVVTASLMRFEK